MVDGPLVCIRVVRLQLSKPVPVELPRIPGARLLQSALEKHVCPFLEVIVHASKLVDAFGAGNGNIADLPGHL